MGSRGRGTVERAGSRKAPEQSCLSLQKRWWGGCLGKPVHSHLPSQVHITCATPLREHRDRSCHLHLLPPQR